MKKTSLSFRFSLVAFFVCFFAWGAGFFLFGEYSERKHLKAIATIHKSLSASLANAAWNSAGPGLLSESKSERVFSSQVASSIFNSGLNGFPIQSVKIFDLDGRLLFRNDPEWLFEIEAGKESETLKAAPAFLNGGTVIEDGVASTFVPLDESKENHERTGKNSVRVVKFSSDVSTALIEMKKELLVYAVFSGGLFFVLWVGLLVSLRRVEVRYEYERETRAAVERETSLLRERLARQELSLRQKALEQSVNAVVVFDFSKNDAPIIYANPASHVILGIAPNDLTGKPYEWFLEHVAVMSGEKEMSAVEELDSAVASFSTHQTVILAKRADGGEFWAELRIAPVIDGDKDTHIVFVINDITDSKKRKEQNDKRSLFDPVTGLHSRFIFDDRLGQAIEQAVAMNEHRALICFDIERFAFLNETHGRRAADLLLSLVGQRIRDELWPGDCAYRQGADEFWVLLSLPSDDPKNLETRARELLSKLERKPYSLSLDTSVQLKFSAGLCLIPFHASFSEDAIQAAGAAVREAKRLGGNRLSLWDASLGRERKECLQIESLLSGALRRGEFHLVWQPQIDLVNFQIRGVEALVRWENPEIGSVSPSRFIPIAEETGHIHEIGRWLVKEVCSHAKKWQDDGFFFTTSMNISARQFRENGFSDFLIETLSSSGVEPQWLEMELTESDWMENPEEAISLFSRLGAMGAKMSIDDFGTGHSSLARIGDFPADALKIDRSFVQSIGKDMAADAIIMAIVSLAKGLNMEIVAEGVERKEEISFLRKADVRIVQGFYFSKPLSAGDLERILSAGGKIVRD